MRTTGLLAEAGEMGRSRGHPRGQIARAGGGYRSLILNLEHRE